MVVEKTAVIVRMDFDNRERQSGQSTPKGILGDQVPPVQHRHPFTPPGGNVDHLQAVDELPGRRRPTVIDQVDLEMPRFRLIPGNAPGGDFSRQPVGLGLAIAKHIVQAHGGKIWVEESPNPPGARFCFTLPLSTH
ncbi:MAG: hypothetical protein JXJ17_09250 [Anaerolineae bacterium]|nr:hypothetical protein [Anaerolineae bacterium]